MISGREKPVHSPRTVAAEVLDELVVYCAENSQALSLNESARAIWELCDGAHTIDDICNELAGCSGVSPARLHDDVCKAVDRLCGLGVVELDAG